MAYIAVLANGAAADTIKLQNIRGVHARTGAYTLDNSSKNVTAENVTADFPLGLNLAMLNGINRGVGANSALTAQVAVYGSHFADLYTTGTPANTTAVAWTRAAAVATVASTAHGLRTGDLQSVTVSSDLAAIVRGQKTVTVTTADAYTFACANAGATSGTLTFAPINGKIAVLMNEPTADTASQVALTGGAAFTSAGTLYMPAVNAQADFTVPTNIRGHASFPIAEITLGTGLLANHYVTYSMDGGATYKNLSYPRAGAAGSAAAFTFTVTSGTGVVIGNYAFGTGVALNAKVTNVVGNTVTVDIANTGAVSGVVRFNQMPNEVVADALLGFPLRIRIKTTTANVVAISSLQILTTSTAASRLAVYPLDTVTLTVTGIVAGSDVVVLQAGTNTVLEQVDSLVGTSYNYVYATPINVDIGVLKQGHVPLYIRNYPLSTTNASLPVAQTADRNYI
jgi:hypothetical protein